ncbi:TonB-dependent receptor [Teredinibacter franksiae]|uniref:TonB-dependent receptor n=1 Tax=Teredinibacter franksiae TaxID=2761453 RepID=UPI001626BDD7|nr:TonB-dependent receptor [Teredinibacter franksiae]
MISTTQDLPYETPKPKASFSKKLLAQHIASLLSGISLTVLASSAALAQNTSEEAAEFELLEEVVVTGIRASQRGAIDLKREAGTMADAIIAEDVSQFPDKNIAEALQRITGVQMTRDFGEGQGINIRGMSQGLNRTEVDGVSALGAGSSRTVDFTQMASELVQVLTVVKGSEARITEGGIGGTVQIEMRKPNDFDDHFFSTSWEAEVNDLTENASPKGNITGVYKITEDVGVMLNLTASDKKTMIHALRNTDWDRWADYDNSPEKSVVNPDFAGAQTVEDCTTAYGVNGSDNTTDLRDCEEQWWDFTPTTPRYGMWSRDERRISTNLAFGWTVNENLNTFADVTYNERDKEALDLNLHLESGSAARIYSDSVVVDDEHNVRAFTTANSGITNRTLQFDWVQRSAQGKVGFEFNKDAWDISGIASHSTSYQDIDSRDTQITQKGVAGVRVELDERGAPEFDLTSGYRWQNPDAPENEPFERISVNDPTNYNERARYKYAPLHEEQDESSAKIDIAYNFDEFFVTKLRTGARWAEQSIESTEYQVNIIRDVGTSYGVTDANGNPVLGDDGKQLSREWTIEDMNDVVQGSTSLSPELFSSFDLDVATIGNYQAVDTAILIDRLTAIDATSVDRNQLPPRAGALEITETTAAAYLQADFETAIKHMRLWGNVGVRYVETETAAVGDVRITTKVDPIKYLEDGVTPDLDENGNTQIDLDPITLLPKTAVDVASFDGRDQSQGNYSDVLPSINLNLEITEDLNLYAGWSKVMARPTITELNVDANCTKWETSRAEINNRQNTCTAGNPDLDPYRATQYDIALSWYPNDDSIVSLAYFNKQLTSYLGPAQVFEDKDFFEGGENAGVLYDVTQKTNITGVTTSGIEFQVKTIFDFLPAPFNNTGGDFNITVMNDADDVPHTSKLDGEVLPLLEQSKSSFNIGGFYEDDNLSIRLAYNYREKYLKRTAGKSGAPVFVDEAGHLDGKVMYTIGESGFTVFADARNMLSEVYLESAGESRLSDLQWAGRTYAFGFTYKY